MDIIKCVVVLRVWRECIVCFGCYLRGCGIILCCWGKLWGVLRWMWWSIEVRMVMVLIFCVRVIWWCIGVVMVFIIGWWCISRWGCWMCCWFGWCLGCCMSWVGWSGIGMGVRWILLMCGYLCLIFFIFLWRWMRVVDGWVKICLVMVCWRILWVGLKLIIVVFGSLLIVNLIIFFS